MFDYLGILMLLTTSICARFKPGTGQYGLWKFQKSMQEPLAKEGKKYTVTACTNYEKLIKAQSLADE